MSTPPNERPRGSDPDGSFNETETHDARNPRRPETNLTFLGPATRPGSLGRLGHYEVLEVLGRGGYGIVLKAFDEVLHRVVAVKVLAPEMAATSPARKRFLREARASAQVRHDNVVQVHAIEETPLPYLVMEYIPGETLQQRMDAVGPVPPEEAVQIGVQIARGLAAAHETGLIHRDVKPANVLLEAGPEKRAKLTDFGLARAADDASLSQSGTVAGTPLYMAPEQARGEPLDHRADLFSLGSVLYAMVTGRPPFRAENRIAVLKRVCEDTPRPPRQIIPEVPRWLCDVIANLHAKDPAKRFQSAREVVEALTRGQAAPPSGVGPAIPHDPIRKRALVGGIILIGLLAVAVVYGVTRDRGSARSSQPDTQPVAPVTPPARVVNMALKLEGKEHQIVAEALERNDDTPVTLECWFFMPGPTQTYRTVLALGGKSAVWIANSPDTIAPLSLRLPVNSFPLGAKIPFGRWAHVALVYDQRETRFYLDGKMQSANPREDPPSKHPRWSVGGLIVGSTRYVTNGQVTFGGPFSGQLDEIRVSRVARYSGDAFSPQRRFDPDADTLALYHCDEGTGAVLTDSSGNGRHATVAGTGVSWVEVAP